MDATLHRAHDSEPQTASRPSLGSDTGRGAGDATRGEESATPSLDHHHLLRVVARTASMHIFAERYVPADEAMSVALSWIARCPEVHVEVLHP